MQPKLPGMLWLRLLETARTRLAAVGFSTFVVLAVIAAALLPAQTVAAQGTVPSLPTEPAPPEWLEPRGLSVVDMVGYVPEDTLRDAILVYLEGTGLVQYASGTRTGNTVVINTNITPRFGPGFTKMGCLGQPAVFDQIPVVVPAGTMQIFANGQDITARINYQSTYIPAGLTQPAAGSGAYLRYNRIPMPTNGASPAKIPANASCEIFIDGEYKNVTITARFTFNVAPQVKVTFKGDQTFFAHSYIGEGNAGALSPLADAMWRTFDTRHDSFLLNIPADADYMFVKYEPTPFDPYAADQYSFNLPGSGTYRFEMSNSSLLSVDHVNSMGIPTWGSWRDADQSEQATFLPASTFKGRIKSPEYFLPPGIPYKQCMTSGGCPSELLNQIYEQTFPVHVYYYSVERLAGTTLTRIPLKQVGPGYSALTVAAADVAPVNGAEAFVMPDQTRPAVYLPYIVKSKPPVPPEQPLPPGDPAGCPCGWFNADGQMFDFIPPQ